MNTSITANIAEKAIVLELERLRECGAFASVTHIPNQDDPNHWDIFVTLAATFACFQVQVKALTEGESTLELKIKHLSDWVRAAQPTVLMWWDEKRKRAYWADILRYLLRTGGSAGRETASFNRAKDLRQLEVRDARSVQRFVSWIRNRCALWHHLRPATASGWPSDIGFPASFTDAIEDPGILLYLPVSHRLIAVLDNYMGDNASRAQLPCDVLRTAREAIYSPESASLRLIEKCGLPEDPELLRRLSTCWSDWRQRIATNGKAAAAKSLWAFDKLISIVGYRQPGDLKLPAFASQNTYPIGRLLGLLPSDPLVTPLLHILEADNDWRVLLYAAWCLGILNHPGGSELWRSIKPLRARLRARAADVGSMWPLVDRQLLYTESQLGGQQALDEYIRRLSSSDIAEFEVAYNLSYYSWDSEAIRYRYERRVEEGFRTDENVIQILRLHYVHLRKLMGADRTKRLALRPHLWAA